MYQIFVVEDELLIRQSLRNTIENMKGPYAFCGEASDGELALSMMQDLMPDILLTDIRMPFLDGFGLIRHARAMMPWLKVVIISGYGEFEYARKAIDLRVDQYLLKPVRPAELTKVIEEMAARIEKEKLTAGLGDQKGIDPDEVNRALRQQFTRDLLFGGADTEKLLERARKLNMDIVRPHYLTTVCYFDHPNPDSARIRNVVQQVMDQETEEDILYMFPEPDILAVLGCGNDEEALNESAYRLVNILRHELRELCPVITAVVGACAHRLGAVGDAYKAAAGMLKRVGGISAGQVVNIGDTAQIAADIVNFTGPFGGDFRKKLEQAGPKDVPGLLKEVFDSPDYGQFDSMLMRYYGLINLMKLSVQIMARNAGGADEKDIAARLSSRYDIFSASGDKETFRKTAEEMLTGALSARQESPAEMKYSHVISRAEQYVRENYRDPNISLISAARYVGMSAAHFSTVFSQTMGKPFIAYLTGMRIEQAKKLLRETTMRLSDIAMEIGYNEPNYFSHVFRKAEGVTPKEFRAGGGAQSTPVDSF